MKIVSLLQCCLAPASSPSDHFSPLRRRQPPRGPSSVFRGYQGRFRFSLSSSSVQPLGSLQSPAAATASSGPSSVFRGYQGRFRFSLSSSSVQPPRITSVPCGGDSLLGTFQCLSGLPRALPLFLHVKKV